MGCSIEPAIDKKKFARLNTEALAVKISIEKNASLQQVVEQTQRMSDEISAIKERISNREERDLLKAYSDLLAIYHDGIVLWRYQTEFPFRFPELKNRIYVGQDVEPIVTKYHLNTETHVYKPTGQHWKSIENASVGIIWHNADDQLQNIKYMSN